GEAADGTEMLGISGAKGKSGLDSCGRDQSVCQLNAVGEGMLFDENDGCGTDRFREGQDPELEMAKRLLDLAHLQLGSGALQKFHKGDDGQGAFGCGVDNACCPFVAAGRPD